MGLPTTQLARSAASGERSPDLARAAAIFLVIFALYFVGYNRTLPETADEMINFSVAQSIAKWHIVSIDQVSTVGPNPEEFGIGGHRYGKYGPLQAVLSVPLFWLAQLLPIGAVDTVLLLNHLVTALTAAIYFLFVRRLGYSPGVALAVVALITFGTPLWIHSKRYFGEPIITLTIAATLYATYLAARTRRRRWFVAAGVAFGAAVAAKYVDGLLLLPVPLYLAWVAWQASTDGRPNARLLPVGADLYRSALPVISNLLWFGIGVAPIAAILGWYDWIRFGDPLASGYAHWETFSTPIWVGVSGFLFSPGKSIFIYTPLFLMLPFWAPLFARRFPSFSVLLGVIVVLHLGLFGAWWVWWGAWAWGPRFIVPILPLLAIFLAQGFATMRGLAVTTAVALLALLSFVIQALGISVDHTIYMVQLMPLNPRPDTLTLYDIRYSPILHQIPLMTRQWLDFAWIERTGPNVINLPAFLGAVGGAVAAGIAFALVWRTNGWRLWLPVLAVAAVIVAGGTFQALRVYNRQIDPTTAGIVAALASAPLDTGIVQLMPKDVIPYANWQKRDLPEIGWIEEPKPNPIITKRLDRFEQQYPSLVVLTQTPPKVPSNGIEALLDRSLVQVDDESIGGLRLLRYMTNPASVHFSADSWQFASGIELAGFAVEGGPAAPGSQVNVVLRWRAAGEAVSRPDYTVFAHLVGADGALVAQHDDPPASGYATTSSWRPGQVIYDDHPIAVPENAAPGLHLVQVGLYLPSDGQRVPLVGPNGKATGDTVTLDLNEVTALGSGASAVRQR